MYNYKNKIIIKGKELNKKGDKLFKVLNEEEKHHNMQYQEGVNIDVFFYCPY